MRIDNVVLTIAPVTLDQTLCHIDVSWVLAVPYWEAGSWCREVVEITGGTPPKTLLCWRSEPWRLPPASPKAEDGVHHRVSRSVPTRLAPAGLRELPWETLRATVCAEPVAPVGHVSPGHAPRSSK
jgi:hypothetical protein